LTRPSCGTRQAGRRNSANRDTGRAAEPSRGVRDPAAPGEGHPC